MRREAVRSRRPARGELTSLPCRGCAREAVDAAVQADDLTPAKRERDVVPVQAAPKRGHDVEDAVMFRGEWGDSMHLRTLPEGCDTPSALNQREKRAPSQRR